MTAGSLQTAIRCLQISDVWQHQVSAFLHDSLQAAAKFPSEYDVLFKHTVARTLWGKADDDEGPYVFRVHIDLGVKFVASDETAKSLDQEASPSRKVSDSGSSSEEEDVEPLAQIETTYVAEYLADEDPGQEALKAFAIRNASYHVWPFWREFLSSQCMRMNLPKVSLPLQSVTQQARE